MLNAVQLMLCLRVQRKNMAQEFDVRTLRNSREANDEIHTKVKLIRKFNEFQDEPRILMKNEKKYIFTLMMYDNIIAAQKN